MVQSIRSDLKDLLSMPTWRLPVGVAVARATKDSKMVKLLGWNILKQDLVTLPSSEMI